MDSTRKGIIEIMDESIFHEHCAKCHKKVCTDQFKQTCPVAPCINYCGLYMHSCKIKDHLLICSHSIQPCVNEKYGCPFKLILGEMSNHLSVCPANVVVCTMEWNRKPLLLQDAINMHGYNPCYPVLNNLEIGLALKDQRVLLESMVPDEILGSILNQYELKEKGSDKHETITLEGEPQQQLVILNDACKFTPSEAAIQEENCVANINSTVSNKESSESRATDQPPKPKSLLRRRFVLAPKKEFKSVGCDTFDLGTNMSNWQWLNPGVNVYADDAITSILEMNGAYEKREPISTSYHSEGLRCTYSEVRLCSVRHVSTQTRPFFDVNKHTGKIGSALQEAFAHEQDNVSLIQLGTHNQILYKSLALHRVMECLPRYEKKSRAMYSFMCNHIFRRDQFQAHFQNVHCEIYSTLDGWLEEKCPYALYGCHFSQFRLRPGNMCNQLIYDNLRSCLTTRPNCEASLYTPKQESVSDLTLLDMPWFVLEHILGYLDSYSMGQATQTCKLLRDVCFSRLKARGIVALNWEKYKRIDGSISWQVDKEMWSFSNSFSKINTWVFNDVPSMSEHVRKCPFAARHVSKYTDFSRVRLLPFDERKV